MAIRVEHEFSFTADQVWAIVGTPDRVDWVPGIEGCEFDGEVRAFKLPGAGFIKERILKRDEATRFIEYSCFESPMPLEKHLASMQLEATENGCLLVWLTEVEPLEVEPFIQGSMDGALVQLQRVCEAEFS